MVKKRWEHFSHQADIGVRGIGASKAEAFEQAALALTAVTTDPRSVHPKEPIEIACEAPDDELLLVDWLNILITESATRHILWCRFDIQIEGHRLRATAWGEHIEPARHHPAVEVKGATYTELQVRQNPDDAWLAQCVVDV
jgi:tRNA nucleotidyltransferase (CCA-adding enzyme)